MTDVPSDLAKRQFVTMLGKVRDQEIVVPRLLAFFSGTPVLPVVSIPIRNFEVRHPDGWFHPSTHPLMTERQLYHYLVHPQEWLPDPFSVTSILAVTQGVFWHYFVQSILEKIGLLRVINPDGEHSWDRVECPVEDPVLRSKGSLDGIINSDNVPVLQEDEGFEFKTMSTFSMKQCPRGAPDDRARLEWWKADHPEYYAQNQEYMRMRGLNHMRVVVLGLQSPFPFIELKVPYSPSAAWVVSDKYARVIQAVADRSYPAQCCVVGSTQAKLCSARGICPIGRS